MADTKKTKFQGSETSRAEVIVYTSAADSKRVSFSGIKAGSRGPQTITFRGHQQGGDEPSLTSVATYKAMGAASGTFVFEFKVPSSLDLDFRNVLQDDDWVDIIMYRHERKYHVMRGLIDEIRIVSSTGRNGATSVNYRVSGRDFGKILEVQKYWFDRVTGVNIAMAATSRQWSEANDFADGTVAATVRNMIGIGLISSADIKNSGAGLWAMPPNMPGAEPLSPFIPTNCVIYQNFFTNIPPRSSCLNPSLWDATDMSIWDSAKAFSDEHLCELYVDLVRAESVDNTTASAFLGEEESDPTTTRMAVIIRDRPFPTFEIDDNSNVRYFRSIPTFEVLREGVQRLDVARNGRLHYNAFFAAPLLFQELSPGYMDIMGPLADSEDIRNHGLRRYDAISRYMPSLDQVSAQTQQFNDLVDAVSVHSFGARDVFENTEIVGAYVENYRTYRKIVRDHNCVNHLLYNGSVSLNYGRPDFRIGSRLRILGPSEDKNETYYIESVAHSWAYEEGIKTSCEVSRGWIGTDASYYDFLGGVVSGYNMDNDLPAFLTSPTDGSEEVPPTSEVVAMVPEVRISETQSVVPATLDQSLIKG